MLRIPYRILLLALLLFSCAFSAFAQDLAKTQPPLWTGKPDVATWEKVQNDRLAAAQRAIDQLVAVRGARTVENTLVPYDEAVRQLDAAANFADLMQQVHHDATFRDRATVVKAKAMGELAAVSLNRDVYKALSAIDLSQADSATRYYVQRQLLESRLAGVEKDDATRKHLKELNEEISKDQTTFDRNVTDDVQTVEVTSVSELAGLPQDYIDQHRPGPDGKIRISNGQDFWPAMILADSDELRLRLWLKWTERAYAKNRDILADMLRKRHEVATLLGYPSWADYNAADKMIRTARGIGDFIEQVDAAARPVAERESAMLLAEKRKTDPQATGILPHQVFHLTELVRRAQYDFDSTSVRPYFPYPRVEQGVLDTAAALFHVKFRREPIFPVWDPSVEAWSVVEDGKVIGRFYLDTHPRPGKLSVGDLAEEATVLEGIRGKQLPEAALVCNFPEPAGADPGLMDYGQVVTFFHEFGHLMHDILAGNQQWEGISGNTHMELDFIEAPSQMLENWMHSPQVLASFARHYKTGEPIPADLVARMNRADAFGRAENVAIQNALSAISFHVHNGSPESVDPGAITLKGLRRYTLVAAPDSDAHFYASFTHLADYSSAYYTYMWDRVIAQDFVQQFDQKNLFAGDAPMRYRRLVLEPGGSMSANDLVKNFLGRPQSTAAFQKWMAEEFENVQPTANTGVK